MEWGWDSGLGDGFHAQCFRLIATADKWGPQSHCCSTIHSHHTPLSSSTQNESLYYSRCPHWQRREPHCYVTSFTHLATGALNSSPVHCLLHRLQTASSEGWCQGSWEIGSSADLRDQLTLLLSSSFPEERNESTVH